MQTQPARGEMARASGGEEESLSVGDERGVGDRAAAGENLRDTETQRYRLSGTAVTNMGPTEQQSICGLSSSLRQK